MRFLRRLLGWCLLGMVSGTLVGAAMLAKPTLQQSLRISMWSNWRPMDPVWQWIGMLAGAAIIAGLVLIDEELW